MPLPDDVLLAAAGLLKDAPTRPSILPADHILINEDLPIEPDELPAVGLYLVDDQQAGDASGCSNRVATVQVQINNIRSSNQDYLSATRELRVWVLKNLMPNAEAETGLEGAEHIATRPGIIPGSKPVAVAVLEFSVPFFHDPLEEA